jgi:hypothetical protein
MVVVCPLPQHWNAIYLTLLKAATAGAELPPPPKPLILGGWAYSSDAEKQNRWLSTLQWAQKWGFQELIPELSTDMMYMTAVLSDVEIGPGYGPMHLPWNFEPRPTITAAEAEQHLQTICAQWDRIADGVVQRCTRPVRLTGAKYRRLVCEILSNEPAPWGLWDRLEKGPHRRSFTELRKAVNVSIAPHMVDHIDFVLPDEQN